MKWILLVVTMIVADFTATYAQNCGNTSVGFPPLNDLGAGYWRGMQGGLYPMGENDRPSAHNDDGLFLASTIQPLDVNGNPDSVSGKIVLLSIGMSNTLQEFDYFEPLVDTLQSKNLYLQTVNGAQGGQDINHIIDTTGNYWNDIRDTLDALGLSPLQVQVVWFKEAEAQPTDAIDTSFVGYVSGLKDKLHIAMNIMKQEFPNAKLCYIASRIYGGYATTLLNPEPFAYYVGWAVKHLIEDQIAGDSTLTYLGPDARSPWLSWGVYLWADGLSPRSDGLTWICPDDYQPDGTHPSPVGRLKVAEMLLDFFASDETCTPWFLDQLTEAKEHEELPRKFILSQNYPNPFNPSTTIRYSVPPSGTRSRPDRSRDGGLPTRVHVRLEIFNLLGQHVALLVDGEEEAGWHAVVFESLGLASGIYTYRLTADDFTQSKNLIFLK